MSLRVIALFAVLVFAGLVGVSAWASGHIGILPAIGALVANPAQGTHPWLVATLFDAYFGFLWFWLWVAYKETRWTPRLVWLLLILGLGNMAMAAYVLIRIARLPAGARVEDLLLRDAPARSAPGGENRTGV
ncbi:DUF1475 family protein [Fontimonas sp. SYSU GA230001]|uniref:DUF1475 family protein n=1 Tax=Fontimonas sp. SYSU GA230001 TaxID=3142450 RepID=UPI0032B4ECB4